MKSEYELERYEKENNVQINKEGILESYKLFFDQSHSGSTAKYSIFMLNNLVDNFNKTSEMISKTLDELSESDDTESFEIQKKIIKDIFDIYNNFEKNRLTKEEMEIAVKLFAFEPLTPLTGEKEEWKKSLNNYQNVRCSHVFKEVLPGGIEIAYDLDSTIASYDGGQTFCFSSLLPLKQITFPYDPSENKDRVMLYEHNNRTFILTDEKTIEQIRENNNEL